MPRGGPAWRSAPAGLASIDPAGPDRPARAPSPRRRSTARRPAAAGRRSPRPRPSEAISPTSCGPTPTPPQPSARRDHRGPPAATVPLAGKPVVWRPRPGSPAASHDRVALEPDVLLHEDPCRERPAPPAWPRRSGRGAPPPGAAGARAGGRRRSGRRPAARVAPARIQVVERHRIAVDRRIVMRRHRPIGDHVLRQDYARAGGPRRFGTRSGTAIAPPAPTAAPAPRQAA